MRGSKMQDAAGLLGLCWWSDSWSLQHVGWRIGSCESLEAGAPDLRGRSGEGLRPALSAVDAVHDRRPRWLSPSDVCDNDRADSKED
jgi:hypothetical protein